MDLIVETDLGRDPDDLFALLYLVSAGVNIRCITISPGHKDQVAVAKFLCKELGLKIPIGSADPLSNKTSSGGVHYELLRSYKYSLEAAPDGLGCDIIKQVMASSPECELFAIGPLTSVGAYLRNGGKSFVRATMQGGFVGYDLHDTKVERLDKFEGLTFCPTFNMNGDIEGVKSLLASDTKRSFVGKNVCHTIVYNHDIYDEYEPRYIPNRAMWLFDQAMYMYLQKHSEKKFHDPTAAVCHLHPEIGVWYENGQLYRSHNGWGTAPGGIDRMLIDIDRGELWHYIHMGT